MAFDAVLGSRTQNSLVSVAQADAVVAERYSMSDWPSTEANKQKALMTASAYLNKFHWEGVRAWAGYQRMEWPRVRGVVPNLKSELPVRGVDHDSPIDRTLAGGSADSGTTTTVVDATFASDKYNYPDDFFNNGALRIGKSGDANEYLIRTVSDFASATGTFTVSAVFPAAVAAGTNFQVIEPLHPIVIEAVVDLAHSIAQEGSGYPTTEEDLIELEDLIGRDLWRVRRRVFDVV